MSIIVTPNSNGFGLWLHVVSSVVEREVRRLTMWRVSIELGFEGGGHGGFDVGGELVWSISFSQRFCRKLGSSLSLYSLFMELESCVLQRRNEGEEKSIFYRGSR